ncbi:signal peptide peptidase SppA [Mucilaginibacter sp. Bleaf8]|uniref:signal peptide peptidase SppA n=1 Tax=Mucilaginibacter sp. Bleaf8 TaxID=2834430 RepID=UPI001BCB47C6|nr:signal peptide peptidase SppA [Mucilaginibacter sp. Bleaf8]MBS7563539.1 signal peptide peptidase SppA [Mucilaginibacter sp. Bleaf8]
MKQFFKFVLASVVGFFIAGFVVFLLFAMLIGGIIASASKDKPEEVAENSILNVSFKSEINERSPNNPLSGLSFLGFDKDKSVGLNDILAGIKRAKTDDHIKGIFLNDSYMLSGQATTEEIRNALIDFKKSKKFIIAYSEIYSQGFYYLASVADKVYINPKGIFEFRGYSSQITFFKGALDKLGIEAQVIKVGTYKSAVEPFILDKMSDANRMQVNAYLGSLYNHFLTSISTSRKIPADSLASMVNQLKIQFPEDAVKYKLVDGLKYKDQVLDELKKMTGTGLKKNLKSVDLSDYAQNAAQGDDEDGDKKDVKNQIAIVYASGEINGGEGDDNSIGSDRISAAIRKARLNDNVKAIVLRVNSPGGSSLASDVIWREVSETKKVKPVIVSMGDYAASGGYYISCAADSIIAQPNTITGSIGIFAILPNMQNFLHGKLGLSFDGVKTGKYADLGDVSRPLTTEERAILQNEVNHGYDDFTKAVASGRHKTQAYINNIGQGRVWTGEQALKIGLVDRLGSINDAINSAARKAKLGKDYKLVAYPEQKGILSQLNTGMVAQAKAKMVKSELGENYEYYQQLKSIQKMMRVPQARLPFVLDIK